MWNYLCSHQNPHYSLWLLGFSKIVKNCQCQWLCKSDQGSLFVNLSYSEIKSPIMCIQSLIIEIKSKRCHLLKIKFIWSNIQYMKFNACKPVIFANNNWLTVRLKSFLWVWNLISDFVVWNLTIHDEVIICGFQTIKVSSKDPRFSWKFISFFQYLLYQYA